MKFIYLNAIVSVPNEVGEEKIEKAYTKKPIQDSSTPPRSWFLEQNLIPPDDAEEIETDEDGRVVLEEDDVDYITVPLTMPIDNLGSWVSSTDGGTHLYTKSNMMYTVAEEVWEIDTYLEYINMSWWEKLKLSFLAFWRKITNKKQVDLQEILARPENQPDYKQE
jgi:hypothetical protein